MKFGCASTRQRWRPAGGEASRVRKNVPCPASCLARSQTHRPEQWSPWFRSSPGFCENAGHQLRQRMIRLAGPGLNPVRRILHHRVPHEITAGGSLWVSPQLWHQPRSTQLAHQACVSTRRRAWYHRISTLCGIRPGARLPPRAGPLPRTCIQPPTAGSPHHGSPGTCR